MPATAKKKSKKKSKKSAKPQTAAVEQPPIRGGSEPALGEIRLIPLGQIMLDGNDREPPADAAAEKTEQAKIDDLARSIARDGLLQPVGVMAEAMFAGTDHEQAGFRLVYGRRRYTAACRLKWHSIPAKVLPAMTYEQMRSVRLIENHQRQELSPVEKATAIAEMLDRAAPAAAANQPIPAGRSPDLPAVFADLTAANKEKAFEAVAGWVGESVEWVRRHAYLARLHEAGRKAVREGRLPITHAREIARLSDPKAQEEVIARAAAEKPEDLPASLDHVRGWCGRHLFDLSCVSWKLDVPFAGKPACVECPFNSANTPSLFDGRASFHHDLQTPASDKPEPKAGVCTLESCYREKHKFVQAKVSAAAAKAVAAADDSKKSEKIKVARAAAREASPDFVKPQVLIGRVEDKLARASGNGTRTGAAPSREQTEQQKAAQERREAGSKLQDALEAWCKTVEKLIAAALAKTPGRWAIYHLIRKTKLYASTRSRDAKAERAAASPAMASMLKMLGQEPSIEMVRELEKGCGSRFALLEGWYDGPSGMVGRFAEALGIDIDDAPTLDDFLPKKSKTGPMVDDGENGEAPGEEDSQ